MVTGTTACLRATRSAMRICPINVKSATSRIPCVFTLQTQSRKMSSQPTHSASKAPRSFKPITMKSFISNSQCARSQKPTQPTFTLAQPGARRSNSTTTATSSSSSTAAAAPPHSPPSTNEPLTWDRYLNLRTIRRRYNTAASALTALSTTFAGAGVIANQDVDTWGLTTFGLDPVIVMGIATLACGAVGWILGPFAGSGVWGLVYRRWKPLMDGKEKDFYRRIKKYRAQPLGQSVNNPVPDYYGEKISSVKGYRRWLKDQRAFRKKRDG